jgi:hypothetical protein
MLAYQDGVGEERWVYPKRDKGTVLERREVRNTSKSTPS